jgi:hypothetical protein
MAVIHKESTAISGSHTCTLKHAILLISAHIAKTNFTADTEGCCWDVTSSNPELLNLGRQYIYTACCLDDVEYS